MSTKTKIEAFFKSKDNYGTILSYCFRLTKDEEKAKDATQELFLGLVSRADNFTLPEGDNDVMRYMKVAAKNQVFGEFRKEKSLRSKQEGSEQEAHMSRSHKYIVALQRLDALNKMISQNQLFTKDQLDLWDCLYQGLSVKEMEEKLGKSRQTIYSLKNKLIEKIRMHFTLEELSH